MKNPPPSFGFPPKDEVRPWYHYEPVWQADPDQCAEVPALQRFLDTKETTYFCNTNNLSDGAQVYKKLRRKFGAPAVMRVKPPSASSPARASVILWVTPTDQIRFMMRGGEECNIELYTTKKANLSWVLRVTVPFLQDNATSSPIYMVSRTPKSGTTFTRLGELNAKMERGNYTPEVLEAFDKAVLDLQSSQPGGRIVLLDGPPGSGKTWLLRALVQSTPVKCIIVNSTNFNDLMDPEFIGSAYGYFDGPGESTKPMVLLLEDADKLIAPRKGKGASLGGLSSALNIGDGLLSDMMDLRIFATTNAKVTEIDDALKRPGRLSVRIHVPNLPAEQATRILHRLTGVQSEVFTGECSLAEVYARARTLGWEPPPKYVKASGRGFLPGMTDRTMHARYPNAFRTVRGHRLSESSD